MRIILINILNENDSHLEKYEIINKLKIISIFIFIYPMFGEDNVELKKLL